MKIHILAALMACLAFISLTGCPSAVVDITTPIPSASATPSATPSTTPSPTPSPTPAPTGGKITFNLTGAGSYTNKVLFIYTVPGSYYNADGAHASIASGAASATINKTYAAGYSYTLFAFIDLNSSVQATSSSLMASDAGDLIYSQAGIINGNATITADTGSFTVK